jgi:hypothetical protein
MSSQGNLIRPFNVRFTLRVGCMPDLNNLTALDIIIIQYKSFI